MKTEQQIIGEKMNLFKKTIPIRSEFGVVTDYKSHFQFILEEICKWLLLIILFLLPVILNTPFIIYGRWRNEKRQLNDLSYIQSMLMNRFKTADILVQRVNRENQNA